MVLRQSYIIYGILILSLFIVSCSSGSSSQPSQEARQQNCVDVQIPYQDNEQYIEQEPYQTVECNLKDFSYNAQVSSCRDSSLIGIISAKAECVIKNNENEPGLFSVRAGFRCNKGCTNGCYSTGEQIITVYSQETKSYEHTDSNIHIAQDECRCICEVTKVPQKQVCENVVKYKPVEKSRVVTKYRTEQRCD